MYGKPITVIKQASHLRWLPRGPRRVRYRFSTGSTVLKWKLGSRKDHNSVPKEPHLPRQHFYFFLRVLIQSTVKAGGVSTFIFFHVYVTYYWDQAIKSLGWENYHGHAYWHGAHDAQGLGPQLVIKRVVTQPTKREHRRLTFRPICQLIQRLILVQSCLPNTSCIRTLEPLITACCTRLE